MSIEFKFNSFQIDMQELQDQHPDLAHAIKSHFVQKKTPKRRKSKKKRKVATLIDEIIKSLE